MQYRKCDLDAMNKIVGEPFEYNSKPLLMVNPFQKAIKTKYPYIGYICPFSF